MVKSKNATSYYLIKDVFHNGKRSTKTVEKIGTKRELQQKYPEIDPLEWAKKYAQERTQAEKRKLKTQTESVIIKYDSTKQIAAQNAVLYNVGFLFLRQVYYDLGLDRICRQIARRHQFKYDLNEILSTLLFTRVLKPGSKKSAVNFAQTLLGTKEIPLHQVYRALEILAEESLALEEFIYRQSSRVITRNTQVLYYDCTNFFFEIEEADEFRKYGHSKEHRPNPLVQMGLFLDGSGIPLAFHLFDGERNEQPSLIKLEKKILKDFDMSKFVVCTDAGLSSQANRNFNHRGQRSYVTTQSIKKLSQVNQEWALDPSGWQLAGSTKKLNLSELLGSDPEQNCSNDLYQATFYKECWLEPEPKKNKDYAERLIVTFSLKQRNYQRQVRERQIQRALKMVEKPPKKKHRSPNDPARFLNETHATKNGEKADQNQVTLNKEQIAHEEKYDGFYALATDLTDESSSLVNLNAQRWEIELAFRTMKHELQARPVFLQKETRIKAHFLTCFLAYLLLKIIQKKLGPNIKNTELIQTLRDMNMVDLHGEGYAPVYTRTDLTDRLHEVFGFHTDMQVVTQKQMQKMADCKK